MAVTASASLALGVALAVSVAVNMHACKKAGEAEARERGKDEVIASLRKEPEWLNKVLVQHENEKINIDDFRNAARQGVKDEMRANPIFKAWSASLLPSPVVPGGGLLGASRTGGNTDKAAAVVNHGTSNANMGGNDKR